MKKSLFFWIIISIIVLLLVVNFLFHLIYFKTFHKNIKPITDLEKQRVIELLNKSINLDEYQIKFGNVYITKHKELVQIELIKGNSKEYYFIDINKGRIIRK